MNRNTAWIGSQNTRLALGRLPSASLTMSANSQTARGSAMMPPWYSSGGGGKSGARPVTGSDARPWGSPASRAVFLQDAAVHHHEDACLARLFSRLLVNHIFLHPDRRNLQLKGLVHDRFHELWPPENIHDVDLLRHIQQRSVGPLAQARLNLRIHRNDAVSVALHVSRHAVAGTQRIV